VVQSGTRIEQAAAAGALALLCEVVDERLAIAGAKVIQPCMQILQDGTPTGRVAASKALKNLALTVESRQKFMKEVEYSYQLLVDTIGNEPASEVILRENCATVLQAFCASTSGPEGLEARVALGKGGAIEACIQLMLDGPDTARVPAAGVLQYLAQSENLKPRMMAAGIVKPLAAVVDRDSVDMWGRAYAAGALRWLSMTHANMRPNMSSADASDETTTTGRKGGGGGDDDADDEDEVPSSSSAGMSLAQLTPKARLRKLRGAPMDTAQGAALDEMKRRTKALIEADCVKVMCRLLQPPKDESGMPIAKAVGKKKKTAPREADRELALTHATGALRHLMLEPSGMRQVLEMNGVPHIAALLESPSTQLRANVHAILALMSSSEKPFVNAMRNAGAPDHYTNLLELPVPKPSTPQADPMAFTQQLNRPASSSGRGMT